MTLHRLLYSSESVLDGAGPQVDQQVASILDRSRARNEAAGLTGALLFASGTFVQVLEGPIAQVEATFERICCDLRHRRLRLFELVACEGRVFKAWSMADLGADRSLRSLEATVQTLRDLEAKTSSVTEIVRIMHQVLAQSDMPAGTPAP